MKKTGFRWPLPAATVQRRLRCAAGALPLTRRANTAARSPAAAIAELGAAAAPRA